MTTRIGRRVYILSKLVGAPRSPGRSDYEIPRSRCTYSRRPLQVALRLIREHSFLTYSLLGLIWIASAISIRNTPRAQRRNSRDSRSNLFFFCTRWRPGCAFEPAAAAPEVAARPNGETSPLTFICATLGRSGIRIGPSGSTLALGNCARGYADARWGLLMGALLFL